MENQKHQVPQEVHQRIVDTCNGLPEHGAVQGGSRRRPLRAVLGTTASIAAAFLLMVGLNVANPAFAESLPVIGGVFQHINGDSKAPKGSFVETYGKMESVQDSPALLAAAKQADKTELVLREVYSDGLYVHCAFDLTLAQEQQKPNPYLYVSANIFATVNGQAVLNQNDYAEGNFLNMKPSENGYAGTVALQLPAAAENGQSLKLAYTVTGLRAFYDEDATDTNLDCDFKGEKDLTADTSHNRSFEGFTGNGDIKVFNVESNPSYTSIQYQIPFWGQWQGGNIEKAALFLPDGTRIRYNSQESMSGQNRVAFDTKTLSGTAVFDGVPKGTQTLILRFASWDSVDNDIAMAETTLDLSTKTYSATTSYLQQGFVQENLNLTYGELTWHRIFNEILLDPIYQNSYSEEAIFAMEEQFQNCFSPEELRVNKDGTVRTQWFKQGTDYVPVAISLEKDGKVLGMGASKESDQSPAEKVENSSYYAVQFALNAGERLNLLDTVTLKLTDPATGATLYSREIILGNANPFTIEDAMAREVPHDNQNSSVVAQP